MEISLNVNVRIGVTDSVRSLLTALLERPTSNYLAVPKPVTASWDDFEPYPTPAEEAAPAEEPTVAEEDAPAEEPEIAEEPTVAEEPAPIEEPEKELTMVDVRKAMDRTRARIQGEDFDNSASEEARQLHRRLTGWFKATAAIYGADKPSLLSDHQSRLGFIKECDALQLVDGELKTIAPF